MQHIPIKFYNIINKSIIRLSIGVLIFLLINPTLAFAQTQSTAVDRPQYGGVDQSISEYLCTPSEQADGRDLERCINKMYRFAIALVFFIVFAGYMYITGGETGKGKAKGILQNALIGIGLLVGSYVILSFINPSLVIFKPIQPPIFTADDLPSCEEIGFTANCIAQDEDKAISSSGKVTAIACPDGLINFDKKAIPVNQGNDTEKICKSLMEKLKQVHAKHPIIVNSTIRDANAESDCHKSNNPKTGACADITSKSGNWAELCSAIKQVSGMGFLNESGTSNDSCGTFVKTKYWRGAHLHVYLATGGGGGGSTPGGSRPNCRNNSEFGFLCDSPAGNPWTDDRVSSGGFTASDSTVQANLNELKKRLGNAGITTSQVRQAYRPHEYSSHLRSFWEAAALIQGKDDAYVKSTGYFCDGNIQFVKKSDIDKLSSTQKNKIMAHARIHDMHKLDEPTTCLSDHGFGYAVDYGTGSASEAERMERFGLCHNLNGNKWNQRRDPGHYVLKEKNRNNQGCK